MMMPMQGPPMQAMPMAPPSVQMTPSLQAHPMMDAIRSSPFFAQCPPGMHFLIPASMIIVKQQVEMLEVLTGWETNNRYDILDQLGSRMYFAAEQSDPMSLHWRGSSRPFHISILDSAGRVCLILDRRTTQAFAYTGNIVVVTTGNNELVGQVVQTSFNPPAYDLYDEQGLLGLRVVGPNICCQCGYYEMAFQVVQNEYAIGEIRKQWGGYAVERFTDADTFGVSVPPDLHPKFKCILLGAVFLLDFMFFERRATRHHRHGHHRRSW